MLYQEPDLLLTNNNICYTNNKQLGDTSRRPSFIVDASNYSNNSPKYTTL